MYIHHWFQATVGSLLQYSSEDQNQRPRLLNAIQMDIDIKYAQSQTITSADGTPGKIYLASLTLNCMPARAQISVYLSCLHALCVPILSKRTELWFFSTAFVFPTEAGADGGSM